MAVVGDPQWNDQMTQLRMQVLKQKLDNTRRADSPDGARGPNEGTVRFHQAMLRRQELLDQIRSEKHKMNEELERPRSYVGRRHRHEDLSPSRMSLPDYKIYESPRHVIQHEFKPVRMNPMEPTVVQPAPVVINAPDGRPFQKGEYMDMMMMQNAQMNQMIMQQMMFSQIPKQNNANNSLNVPLTASDLLNLKKSDSTPRPQSVHHHHYDGQTHTRPPQPNPYFNNYYPQLPPIGYQVQQPPPIYAAPRYVPAEVEPLRQPRDYYR